jgi:hypothetical protein
VFLVNAFGGDIELGFSVNHLLVVGFYLINLGYVTQALRQARTSPPQDSDRAGEFQGRNHTAGSWPDAFFQSLRFQSSAAARTELNTAHPADTRIKL